MKTKFLLFGAAILILCGPVPGLSAAPIEYVSEYASEYASLLREEADSFSSRLTGDPGTDGALAGEYLRWAEGRMNEILDRWEKDASEASNRDPIEASPGAAHELSEVRSDLEVQRYAYRRRFEQMAELFARRYLTPQGSALSGMHTLQEAINPGMITPETEAEPIFYGTDPSTVSEWRDAEEKLLEERKSWEEMVEQEYTRQLEEVKLEYTKLIDREESWERSFMENYLSERGEWEELLAGYKYNTGEYLGEFGSILQGETEKILVLQQKLAASLSASESMIQKAEEGIFLGEDLPYWKKVKEENLEFYADTVGTMEAMIGELSTPVETMEKNLMAETDFRLELARQDRSFLDELIRYLSLKQEERPTAAELKAELSRKEEEYLLAREEYGAWSARAAEARDSLVLTGRMYDFSETRSGLTEETGMEGPPVNELEGGGTLGSEPLLLEKLRADLEIAAGTHEVLEIERNFLKQKLSGLIEAAGTAEKVLDYYASLEEEEFLKNTGSILEHAAATTQAKEELLESQMTRLDFEIKAELRDLFSTEDTDASLALAKGLTEAMPEGKTELLKDFAFALYYQKGEDLDPGYISANQVYRKLKSKIGYSEEEGLGEIAREAYESVRADSEQSELFDIYAGLLDSARPESSVLLRAVSEDLGEVLFSSIIGKAKKRIDSLKTERAVLLGQAAYYSGLAAVAYSTLNFPGGAILTAIAAGFTVGAAEVKEKMDDISSLRSSLGEQQMSGAEERGTIQNGLTEVAALEDQHRQTGVEYALFRTDKMSADRWIEEMTAGEGPLQGILNLSGKGAGGTGDSDAEFLRESLGELAEGYGELYTLGEFLNVMEEENSLFLRDRELRNRDLENTAGRNAREVLYGLNSGSSEEELKEFIESALIVEKAGSRSATLSTERLANFRLLFEELSLKEASVRTDLMGERLEVLYTGWGDQKDFLYERGKNIWDRIEEDLKNSVSDWDSAFRGKYAEDRKSWDLRSLQLEEYRRRGMKQLSEESARDLVARGIEELHLSPSSLADRSTLVDMTVLPRWSTPLARSTPFEEKNEEKNEAPARRESLALFSLLEREDGIEFLLPELTESRRVFETYGQSIDGLYGRAEEMLRDVSFDTGLREMERIIRDHQEDLLAVVDRANQQTAGSFHTTLRAAGYRKNGEIFQRNTLVDLTLFRHEKEAQTIHGYRDFQMDDPGWDRQLETLVSRGASTETNQSSYERLLEEINAQRQLVFGDYEGEGSDPAGLVSDKIRSLFVESGRNFRDLAAYEDHSDLKGLLAWHIGFGPEMDPEDPTKVGRNGAGEAGRIMTAYYINEARLGRGLSMMDTAAWDRRLWDDDHDNDGESDGLVKAATMRSLADLGVQAAASLLLPPGAGSLLAGLSDDLFFAAAGMAGGYVSAGEAAFGVGKKALLQTAMAGNSLLWGGSASLPVGWSEGRNIFDGVLTGAGQTASASLLSSAAAAVELQEGNLVWENERFLDGLTGKDSQFSLFSSIAGNLGSNLVENSFFDRESLYGFSTGDISDMRSSVHFGGELMGAAAEYVYTGSTGFNLAGIGTTGLLELRLEDGGFQWAAGSGGTRVSGKEIVTLATGLQSFLLNGRIGSYAKQNFIDPYEQALAAQVLRFQNSFGDDRARETLDELLEGDRNMVFVDNSSWRGNTSGGEDDLLTSLLSREGRDNMTSASYALTLQHEGYRDGITGIDNASETMQAVQAHNRMARNILLDGLYGHKALQGDQMLLVEMAMLGNRDSGEDILRELYDSSGDYWKMVSGGALMWDGSHHLWGEGGHLIASHERGSFSQDLADFMGIEREEALVIMKNIGLVYDSEQGTYVQTGEAEAIPANQALKAIYDMERRFRPHQEGLIPVSGNTAYAWASREHAYKIGTDPGYGDTAYGGAIDKILDTPSSFTGVTGLAVEDRFPGIRETATLYEYSQQYLEEAVTGVPLDASAGNGYCLAEAIAFNYVDRVEGVSWKDLENAFTGVNDWGGSFDPYSGYVADKGEYTRLLSQNLGLTDTAREYRFSSLEDLNGFLGTGTSKVEDYHVVADYGSHFTHVRADGLEVNTYPGWEAPAEGPQRWRVYLWDSH